MLMIREVTTTLPQATTFYDQLMHVLWLLNRKNETKVSRLVTIT